MVELARSRALIASARADLAKAALALGIGLAVVGCHAAPEKCTESARGLATGQYVSRQECPSGARVAVEYFNERTWVMCRCGSVRTDGGQ